MPDREKVVKGLECCLGPNDCDVERKEYCPYKGIGLCAMVLCFDVLALLKEQESEAKWIYGEDETGVDGWRCSECNFFEPWFYEFTDDIDFIRFYKHCPSCGRKMTSYTGKPAQTGG